MKKLLFLLAIALGCSFTNVSAQNVEDFSFEITNQTSREQLAEMKGDIEAYGVLFQYNPSFDMDRNLNGIKVRVTFEEGTVLEYAMNPLNNGMTLTMERVTEEDGTITRFVGQK